MKRYIQFAMDRANALQSLQGIVERIRARIESQDSGEIQGCEIIAAELEISEYEVFRRAYAWYYGHLTAEVESEFSAYLLSGCEHLPCYVNQFTRCWRPGELAV